MLSRPGAIKMLAICHKNVTHMLFSHGFTAFTILIVVQNILLSRLKHKLPIPNEVEDFQPQNTGHYQKKRICSVTKL